LETQTPSLQLQALPAGYLAQRKEWHASATSVAAALRLPNEALHDGMLLLDRAAAAGALTTDGPPSATAAAACLLLACEHHGEGCRTWHLLKRKCRSLIISDMVLANSQCSQCGQICAIYKQLRTLTYSVSDPAISLRNIHFNFEFCSMMQILSREQFD